MGFFWGLFQVRPLTLTRPGFEDDEVPIEASAVNKYVFRSDGLGGVRFSVERAVDKFVRS